METRDSTVLGKLNSGKSNIYNLLSELSQGSDAEVERLVRQKTASKERQRLERAFKIRGRKKSERVGDERAIEKIVRKQKTYDSAPRRLTTKEMILLLRDKRPSKLLDKILPDRNSGGYWKRLKDRAVSENLEAISLERFSFLDEPKSTLAGLMEIAKAEALAPGAQINFKDKYCLDVAPDWLVYATEWQWRQRK